MDIGSGVEFSSYFSCMDMIEALHGKPGDVSSYLDYGYFGVLGADFDEEGHSTGEYTPKMSFKALQNLCSVLCNDYDQVNFPVESVVLHSDRVWGDDMNFDEARRYSFRKPNGSLGMFYWKSSHILTDTYDGTVSIQIPNYWLKDTKVRLANMLTGEIYEIPESMIKVEKLYTKFVNIPITDYPLLLTIGDFID